MCNWTSVLAEREGNAEISFSLPRLSTFLYRRLSQNSYREDFWSDEYNHTFTASTLTKLAVKQLVSGNITAAGRKTALAQSRCCSDTVTWQGEQVFASQKTAQTHT